MKQEFKPMSWLVKNFDCNRQVIEDYDILKYHEADIKKLKKKYNTKEEFARVLKSELMYHYWSRSEYELIIERTNGGHIWLFPWCGCRNPREAAICVDDYKDFDWRGFAEKHVNGYGREEKIDIWDQLNYVWQNFVDYCWNYRHKWQRRKKDELLDTF